MEIFMPRLQVLMLYLIVEEIIVTIMWMIVGVGLYSYTIGLLASVLAHIDYRAQNLSRKKAIMNEFCDEKNVSKALKDKLK